MSTLMNLDKKTLWEKFPIVLKPYNPDWKTWYEEEKHKILKNLDQAHIKRINHIGSTAIEGMLAKPTVDILLESKDLSSMKPVAKKLLELGYLTEGNVENPSEKMMFMKGYTDHGYASRIFHLHLRIHGDWHELYFRDYLLEHEDVSKAYMELKRGLHKKYEFHRDNYTNGKETFIKKWTEVAKNHYKGRYDPYNG
ncbi:MAG: GrpB family protein [Bacillota bacterium]